VVYHVKAAGGAVFAAGSIAWTGALGVDQNVSRITRNVLARFVDPAPLPW
jgi:N,N-dimethylformamidase